MPTEVYAVLAPGDQWRIAIKVPAIAYGRAILDIPPDQNVWSEIGTTALIIQCGDEKKAVLLEVIE